MGHLEKNSLNKSIVKLAWLLINLKNKACALK